jgi:arylsulfatase A-like enzyme
VPLLIKMPGHSSGQVLDVVVSSVDIPGLILDAVSPALAAQHQETFPYRIGKHPVLAECYYGDSEDIYNVPWASRFMQVQTAVWEWPWKLIASSTGKHKLFHLERDPGEKDDLSSVEESRVLEMLERLETWKKTLTRHVPDLLQNQELSEEERQALENLGYL